VARFFKGCRRKTLPIFASGADHAFQASSERQTTHSPSAPSGHELAQYDASLRNRGSLTLWFTPDAIAGWKAQPRATPRGQRHYSDLAIENRADVASGISIGASPERGHDRLDHGLLMIDCHSGRSVDGRRDSGADVQVAGRIDRCGDSRQWCRVADVHGYESRLTDDCERTRRR